MERRNFIKTGTLATSLSALTGTAAFAGKSNGLNQSGELKKHQFKLKYAPHFGMFKTHAGEDLLDQLKFMADVGFKALEDNRMMRRDVSVQEKIASEMDRLGMEMGVFVADAEFREAAYVTDDKAAREKVLNNIKKSIEVAKRCNATYMTVVPGAYSQKLPWDYQTANCIELLKRCSELLEPHNLVMVLEPLNWYTNHPGLFLTEIPQAYMICRAVNSPSCKILDDLYHQQITEGNLIPNIDKAWEEISYIQVGDNPGRKEPTTGEINYKNIFKHLYHKGYKGIIGMEHGNSIKGKAGELAVINAYAEVDSFEI